MTDKLTGRHGDFDILHTRLPKWVPDAAQMYLAHTESGMSIRALARAAGCHASTVLRQIRRIEAKRDDPLVDAALNDLGVAHFHLSSQSADPVQKEQNIMHLEENTSDLGVSQVKDPKFAAEAYRVLRRLCETKAVLAVAANMEKAVIVKDSDDGIGSRTAVVDRKIAEAMALKDWIHPDQSGKITRYSITCAGRRALEEFLEQNPQDSLTGFAESQSAFHPAMTTNESTGSGERSDERPRRMRYNVLESPLTALARRKDKSGEPFLTSELVSAGEQLREDFELAQMGPRVTQNWDRFLTAGGQDTFVHNGSSSDGPTNARQRVADALQDLGPGLSDVVLRCCCYLEGLETAEKKLGWSARSGKIVLRIALIRLKRHYDETVGPGGPLIG